MQRHGSYSFGSIRQPDGLMRSGCCECLLFRLCRYLFLRDLQKLAPRVFYTMLFENTEEILPFIYTVRDPSRLGPAICVSVPWFPRPHLREHAS